MAFPTNQPKRQDVLREAQIAKMGLAHLQNFPEYSLALQLVRRFNTFTVEYETTHPLDTRYTIWLDQAYRSTTSILANVAEGVGRSTPNMQNQFYRTAKGSGYEALSLCLAPPIPIPDDLLEMYHRTLQAIDTTLIKLAEIRLNSLD